MGLQAAPAYLGSGNYQHPATLDRAIIRSSTGNKTGVFESGDFVVAPTTGLNVTITKGSASILGADSPALQGHYYAWSEATETKACVAAHATLKRVDALVLRVVDTAYAGGYTQGAVWEWISGTAASSPTAPTDSDINTAGNYKPGAWLRVANVQINNGDTVVDPSRITDMRTWTTNANGLVYAATAAARIAMTNKAIGDKCWQIDTKNLWTWDGTYWLPQIGQSVFKAERAAAGSLASGAAVGLDNELWDLLGGHDNATNNSRYVCQVPGKYEFGFGSPHQVIADLSAIILSPRVNGTGAGMGVIVADNSSASAGTKIQGSEQHQMAVTDYFDFTIGNNVGTGTTAVGAFMTAKYLGP